MASFGAKPSKPELEPPMHRELHKGSRHRCRHAHAVSVAIR